MTDTSSILSLPYIQPSQAQKHVTHNEALRALDVLVQLGVASDSQTTPPPIPVEGDRYIVPAGGLSDWAGQDGNVAAFVENAWQFFTPLGGWRAYVLDRTAMVVHDGSAWSDLGHAELQDVLRLGLGMTAGASSPFSARLNAALWTALYAANGGDGSLIQTLNKEAPADDSGFLLQTDFVSRALIGLFGTDNLRLAVSPDGTTFLDGLVIDKATGVAEQPKLPRFKGSTNFHNFAAANTWIKIAINDLEYNDQNAFDASTNLFTAPVAGSYLFGATLHFKQDASNKSRMNGHFVVNGTTEVKGSFGELTSSHFNALSTIWIHGMASLAAGDTVELQGKMRAFDAYFHADNTCFWGAKIG